METKKQGNQMFVRPFSRFPASKLEKHGLAHFNMHRGRQNQFHQKHSLGRGKAR